VKRLEWTHSPDAGQYMLLEHFLAKPMRLESAGARGSVPRSATQAAGRSTRSREHLPPGSPVAGRPCGSLLGTRVSNVQVRLLFRFGCVTRSR
jgi:hypothetical protein